MKRFLLVVPVLLVVSGCARTVSYWAKPGGSDAALAAVSDSCANSAGNQFPPVSLGRPGFYPNPTTHCIPTAGGLNCTVIGAGYLPQARSEADTNAPPRMAAFQRCMVAAGWKPLGVAADGLVYLPPGLPAPALPGGRS